MAKGKDTQILEALEDAKQSKLPPPRPSFWEKHGVTLAVTAIGWAGLLLILTFGAGGTVAAGQAEVKALVEDVAELKGNQGRLDETVGKLELVVTELRTVVGFMRENQGARRSRPRPSQSVDPL